ncbi:MAG: hypothetical protein ACOC8B_03120 [Gemmatimonadota bacterium]
MTTRTGSERIPEGAGTQSLIALLAPLAPLSGPPADAGAARRPLPLRRIEAAIMLGYGHTFDLELP